MYTCIAGNVCCTITEVWLQPTHPLCTVNDYYQGNTLSYPALSLIAVNCWTSFFFNAAIKFSGIPHNPNPTVKQTTVKHLYTHKINNKDTT